MATGTAVIMGTRIITAMDIRTVMDTATTTPTAEPSAALLRLLAWMSPSFPTGAFSYSHGLEMAVEDGSVRDAATLRAYVATALAHGAGRTDAAFLALAWRAADVGDDVALSAVAERAAAMRGSAELALESLSQGRAFLSTVCAAWPLPRLARAAELLAARGIEVAHPVAVALVGSAWSIPLADLLLAHLHAFVANLVSAGVRLVPLGQTDGQRALAALEPSIRAAADGAAEVAGLDEIWAAAPAIDLLSIRHETQYTRLFRS
ncbi:MAG: urease accessory protein UreF [Rhodospirillales bacterium]